MAHDGRDTAQRHGGKRTGEVRPQRVSGERRVHADAQDDAVHLLCHANNADDQHRPRDNGRAVWIGRECGEHELDEHQVEHHEHTHTGKHPQPASEDIAGAFRATHRKGKRRAVGEDTKDHIPLRNLKEQPDKLPLNHDIDDNDDEPACIGERVKGLLTERLKGDGVRHLQHLHDSCRQAEADITDLAAHKQQEGKHCGAQEQPCRLLRLDPDARDHRAHCLICQVADEQRPSHCDKDVRYFVYDRHALCEVGKIYIEQLHELVQQVLHHLIPERRQPFKQGFY